AALCRGAEIHLSGNRDHCILCRGNIYGKRQSHSANRMEETVKKECPHGGADRVLEVAGTEDTFRMAWKYARPNGIVTVVALYDEPQTLPLPEMYGKNLTFKTGGVDGCDCEE